MRTILTVWITCAVLTAASQTPLELIHSNRSFAASNYSIYPDTALPRLSPAPKGKQPFYISHYGRHGSRYVSNRKGFDIPYKMLCIAEDMDELTDLGKEAIRDMRKIYEDTEKHWGDLTSYGQKQHRGIARRMIERFPEVFSGRVHIDARSTIVPRCILSMGSTMHTMARINPELDIHMDASQHDMWFMNFQDSLLRKNQMKGKTEQAYNDYINPRNQNPRLMELLFLHPDSVAKKIDPVMLNYYLIKIGLFQMNTHLSREGYLMDIFTEEEIYRLWQWENVWWYIMHGPCLLNGGKQPYTQRHLLRRIINDADSCIQLEHPGAQLRFGHETVLLPLTCLIGINGFDYETDNLEEVEHHGWWASKVFPMGSNLQFIFYRSDPEDDDVVFKVLLNEQEAWLPIPTDMAPYYHWKVFRAHYLRKIDVYEQWRRENQ